MSHTCSDAARNIQSLGPSKRRQNPLDRGGGLSVTRRHAKLYCNPWVDVKAHVEKRDSDMKRHVGAMLQVVLCIWGEMTL